jgi:hypothetical protein
MSRRAERAWLFAIALGAIALRAPLWDLPLERDEGGYAYIAWRMGHGEVPYRDHFDQKPPGIFLAYRLALAVPGDPVVAIRALAAVASALSAVAVHALARPLVGAGAPALLAALLFALLSADPMIQGPIANTELFMLPGAVAATALLLRELAARQPSAQRALAIGLLLGVATTMKQVAAVYVPFFLLVVAWRAPAPQRWRRLAHFSVWLAVGGLLVWLPILAWLHAAGALEAALDALLLHNLEYAGAVPLAARLAALRFYAAPLLPSQGAAWILAVAGLLWLALRQERFPAWFLAGFALASAIGVSASGRYFPHYFQQLLPAVAALAAATALVPLGAGGWQRRLRAALPVVALAPLVASHVATWRLDTDAAVQRIYPGNPFEAMPAIAREIAAESRPDERVFVFGAEPELLFYAQRASASRYIYLYPFYGSYPDVEARRRELVDALESAPPALIAELPNLMTRGGDLAAWLERFTAARYRPHAMVVWDAHSRGRLVRIPEGEDPLELTAGGEIWATLWVRRDLPPRAAQ